MNKSSFYFSGLIMGIVMLANYIDYQKLLQWGNITFFTSWFIIFCVIATMSVNADKKPPVN